MNQSVSRESVWQSARQLSPREEGQEGGKRVLVLGCSPLPFENERMNYAPGTRTWQFARPLAEAGHAVCVACSRIPGAYREDLPDIRELSRDGVLVYTLKRESFESPDVLPGLVDTFEPDVLVGASALPSRRAVRLADDRPVWVDLFGDPMAEAQAKAAVDGHDDLMAYFYLMWSLLERGDAFSAVSQRQRYAVIGQLGLFGRLNRATLGQELVHTLPCGVPETDRAAEGGGRDEAADAPETVVPEDVAPDDFVVLWSGGFNTWCDVDTLFPALERAMAENPAILFVSTGGEIQGHDEDSYARFIELVEASELRNRFLLKGQLPAVEAERYLNRADLGLVTEKPIYERVLGSSARMVNWVARGLPFICTRVSELSETITEHDLGLTYPPGDTDALVCLILEAAADREELRDRGQRGRRFAMRQWTPRRTTTPLCDWVARARRLPDYQHPQMRPFVDLHCASEEARNRARIRDHEARIRDQEARIRDHEARIRDLQARIRDLQERLDRREASYHELRGELGRIHTSKVWRWWMRYLAVRRTLLRPLELFRTLVGAPPGDDRR